MDRHLAEAIELGRELGFPPSCLWALGGRWVVSDPRHVMYGSPVPAGVVYSAGVLDWRGRIAFGKVDYAWTTAVRLSEGDAWVDP